MTLKELSIALLAVRIRAGRDVSVRVSGGVDLDRAQLAPPVTGFFPQWCVLHTTAPNLYAELVTLDELRGLVAVLMQASDPNRRVFLMHPTHSLLSLAGVELDGPDLTGESVAVLGVMMPNQDNQTANTTSQYTWNPYEVH